MKILIFAVIVLFSNNSSFGQFGRGTSQESEKTSKVFEHLECGIRFPQPGTYTVGTSIGYSSYRELGEGMINRFEAYMATYDIGCINLDDSHRKIKKDELISLLNLNTKAYLADSSEFISLPPNTVKGREIYEFETKTDYPRRIKYVLEGNRILIFLVAVIDVKAFEEASKLFDSVEYFSIREISEERMKTATQKSLPQSPSVKVNQTDAARNNLKGLVKSVRIEAEDVLVLIGIGERRIRSDESYDRNGNLLKDFWFQNAGYPTSVAVYGFVEGKRVSDSEEIGGPFGRSGGMGIDDLPPPDPRYDYRYEYKFDDSKRLIEEKIYGNRGLLNRIHTFTYKDGLTEEKRLDADGKLVSTKRRQFDKKGNEIRYEFWWYDNADREIETYEYEKFDRFGNWTKRRVIKTIIDREQTRTRTANEFRTLTYYEKK